jgi:hypothetical protein
MKNVKFELVVALAAIFVSTATMFVYIYQTRIMQKQQHVAVWPYVEFLPSFGPHGFYIEITNKGIGPALVKNVAIKLNGKKVSDLSEMFQILTDSAFTEYGYSTVRGRVIAPSEVIRAFEISDLQYAEAIRKKMTEQKFEYEICYCSVFNDCWTSKGTVITESTCK